MNLQSFFDRIFYIVKEYSKSYKQIEFSQVIENWNKQNVETLKGQYLHDSIYNEIITKMEVSVQATWMYDNTKIRVLLLYSQYDKERSEKLMSLINMLVFLVKRMFKRNLDYVDIMLIHIDKPKVKPKQDGVQLTSEHINSGVSWRTGNKIVVYRIEEMVKVLIHELIHVINHNQRDVRKGEEEPLNKYFNISPSKSVTINESFTDTLACIINTALYTIKYHETDYHVKVMKNFEIERNFIMNQAINVLSYTKYKIKKNKIYRSYHIIEYTHVISYYVLKALMIYKIDLYINYLFSNTFYLNDPIKYINIIMDNLIDFCSILYLIKSIKQRQEWRKSSLRMTSLSLDNL